MIEALAGTSAAVPATSRSSMRSLSAARKCGGTPRGGHEDGTRARNTSLTNARTACSSSARDCARSDVAGPCHRQDGIFRRPELPGHAASENGAQPAPSRPHPIDRYVGGREASGRGADDDRTRMCRITSTPSYPDPDRPGGRAGAGRRQGALEGRGDRRGARRQRASGARGGREGQGRLRGAAGGASTWRRR